MKHARLDDTLREQAALYALGALPPDEHQTFARHLDDGCGTCRTEVESLATAEALLALATPPVAPPPEVRARVLADARAAAPFRFVMRDQGEWSEVQPGVYRRMLEAGAGATSFLIRLDPGARVPTHRHDGAEHCYVVEGDVRITGRDMRAATSTSPRAAAHTPGSRANRAASSSSSPAAASAPAWRSSRPRRP